MPTPHDSVRLDTSPSRQDVARRAYELFQARGAEPGHDLENWLDAERELNQMPERDVHEPPGVAPRDQTVI